LIAFRQAYQGKLFLEVFILPGCNDGLEHLNILRGVIADIRPDKVQLNTLDRPGVVEGLTAASEDGLLRVMDILNLDNVEIISKVQSRKQVQSYRKNAEDTILETIARRPCTLDDLATILNLHVNEINKYLDVLEKEGKIESTVQARGRFYKTR